MLRGRAPGQSLETARGARSLPKIPHPSNLAKLATISRDSRHDIPLRAQSVSLSERPRSNYARTVRSADPNRLRCAEKQFFHHRPPSVDKKKPKPSKVLVKQQKRKVVEKVPCAISVQTLSIPMKYADSTSTQNLNTFKIDCHNRTKPSNPPKQVSEKRLCESVGGKETENKLLLQISEADQVSDFERILNSNAILCERARGHVWRGSVAPRTPPSSSPRPRSSYSLRAVSQAYHYLFRRHEDSLQPLIDHYRQTLAQDNAQQNLLGNNWENLQDLQEFYEDDLTLKKEIETVTDQFITEEVQAEAEQSGRRQKNFNVNLASLIDLHVTGEGFSPSPAYEPGQSPDKPEVLTDEEEEWLGPSMSADDRHSDNGDSVNCLAQNLDNVKLDSDAKIPTITFSNCSDGTRSELPNNNDVVIHLAVPAIDSIDETRPPMM